MKRLLLLSALILASITLRAADVPEKLTIQVGDTVRTYAMYLPASLQPGAPLVVYTHGYGSKTRWRDDLNQAAARHGFAVCYPDGAPDTRGKDGWMVGYPPQYNMRGDEIQFFRALLDKVCADYNLSRQNVFMAGMSNGGDLCYQLAYTCPELFRAYASVAGLLFEWVYLQFSITRPVPFMEIHGNRDTTSYWTGDHTNKGGWGKYIPVPLAVSSVAVANRCMTMTCDTIPSLRGGKVFHTLYSDAPSGCDVEVYEVDGAKHSWHAKDFPTSETILRFFLRYMAE